MKLKKHIAISCSLLLLLSVMLIGIMVFAQNTATIYSDITGDVTAGTAIRIPVSIRNNPGIMGFMLEFEYDADSITPTSVEYGDVLSGGLQDNIEGDAEPGNFKVYWAGNENNDSDGVLFYINATVDEAAAGETAIQVQYSQPDTFDEDFNDVTLSCEDITFNIQNTAYSQYAKFVASADDVVAGENAEITLHVSDISGVSEASLTLTYDADNFSFVSAESTASVTALDNNGSVSIDVSDITQAMNNTDIVTLIFKSDDKAKSGAYTFDLTSEDEGIVCKACVMNITPSATSEIAEISMPQGLAIEQGETVEIPVMISNNHGIMGYRLTFQYNPQEIEIISVKGCNDISGDVYDSLGNNPSSFDVLWNYTSEVSADARLFLLEIRNISTEIKETEIEISYSQQDTFNEQYEDVVFDCHNASITLCPGHSYTRNTVSPTCTEKGYDEYVCEYCSNTYQENFTDEIGHYYHYTGNQEDYLMTYVCEDCGAELSINADEVFAMWNSSYLNVRPNNVDNRTKTDNSSLLNVISDSNVDDGIINAKDYALLLQLQNANN